VSANAAAAMAYRAREKLRQAYLQAHLLASPSPEHEPYRSQLGAYVRDGLSARDRAAVQAHLDGCESCRDLVGELNDVNRMLVLSVAPLFLLGGGGGAVLVAGAGGAAVAAGAGAEAGGSGAVAAAATGKGAVGKLKQMAPSVGSAVAITAVAVAGLAGLVAFLGRDDSGPPESAGDAQDIGRPDGSRGDGSSGGGADSDTGDPVFGGDDFALAPFDESTLDDSFIAPFDEGSGVDDFDAFGSDSPPRTRPPSTTPPTTTPPTTTPPTTTPPTTTPPTTDPGPGPTPTPPTLAFNTSVWTPLATGQGTLALTIGEAGVPAGLTATAFAGAPATAAAPADEPPAPLRLELSLTAGAVADPEGTLDSRCAAPVTIPGPVGGQLIGCTLDQPPTGGAHTFTFGLVVNAPGQTATARLFRGDAIEAELPAVTLDRLEDEVALTGATWTPYRDERGLPLPIGEVGVGASNAGTRTVAGGAIRITFGGSSAAVPPEVFSEELPPGGLLDSPPLGNLLPPALRDTLLTRVLDALPPGCAVEEWTVPTSPTDWDEVLGGELAETVVCQLGDLAPQASASFPAILAVTQPLYHDPQSPGPSVATIQLEVDGAPVGAPQTLDLRDPGNGPGGGG
jgi:Putative zinc-finger